MNIDRIIAAVQTELKKNNPQIVVDGKAGPQTWEAIAARLLPPEEHEEALTAVILDARSERLIATLLPQVGMMARTLCAAARAKGIDCRIISAHRTDAEQNALYAQGRTKPGRIVTNARAGQSNHNFKIAWDVGIFSGTRYLDESPLYKVVGSIGQDLGLDWGGTWKSIQDEPHFQLRPQWAKGMSERQMLAEFRNGRAFA